MMRLLARLLGHDHDTTRELLDICATLDEALLDHSLDAGLSSVRATLEHMIFNIETWTAMMLERPLATDEGLESLDALSSRFEEAHAEFASLARRIQREGRYDEQWMDVLDNPPRAKSFGGAIGHVLVHNTHHRAELLHMLARLNVPNLPEGDLMGWDMDHSD